MSANLRSDDLIEKAMRRAIGLAREAVESGNYPLGAVVIDAQGTVIGEASSSLVKGVDPSGHPEVVAMRRAAEHLQSRYLQGCWLVSTLEPCPMCTSMAIWGKFTGIAYGTSQPHAIAFGERLNNPLFTFRQILLRCEEVVARGVPVLQVVEGALGTEADGLLEEFRKRVSKQA